MARIQGRLVSDIRVIRAIRGKEAGGSRHMLERQLFPHPEGAALGFTGTTLVIRRTTRHLFLF
jgi:hypothetical protein